jgi:hypothetical protein
MRINSPLARLSVKQVKQIVSIIIYWCFNHLGENIRIKKPLNIELDFESNTFDCAEYDVDEEERIIRIFMINNNNVRDLISAILHEYTHDGQPKAAYDRLYKKYGYSRHPHEKQAYKIEKRFTLVCWNDIKHEIAKKIKKS